MTDYFRATIWTNSVLQEQHFTNVLRSSAVSCQLKPGPRIYPVGRVQALIKLDSASPAPIKYLNLVSKVLVGKEWTKLALNTSGNENDAPERTFAP
jgi:hypothetical protein